MGNKILRFCERLISLLHIFFYELKNEEDLPLTIPTRKNELDHSLLIPMFFGVNSSI